jgi:hypothetical protein
VKLCASTRDSFTARASIDNVLDGFLARFVIFTGEADPRPMRRSTPELLTARLSLIDHAKRFQQTASQLQLLDMDDVVFELMWALEQDWKKRANDSSRPDAAAATLKRLSESVLKVAALLAIDQAVTGDIPQITAVHFEQARLMGSRWLTSGLSLIDELGRTGFQQQCEGILVTLRAHPNGMRARDLYRKHRKLNNREFNDVLTALQTQDEIEIRDGDNGKGPAYRFVVSRRTP